ncbi:HNH endonuclease [Nitrosomonas sp. Is79A3]
MLISAKKPCAHPGCDVLVRGVSRCDKHRSCDKKLQDQNRESSSGRGYGHKWRQAREGYLKKHPLCVRCDLGGFVEIASIVDHIVPHRLGEAIESGDHIKIDIASKLFWDRNNWQSLCKTCHDRKTAIEDGGFGRRGRVESL